MSLIFKLILLLAKYLPIFSHWLGRAVSWCSLLLVLLVFVVATMRYVFKIGSIPMQEIIIYLHGMIFMLAASYTLASDEHVRVDVFYARMSDKGRAWVNLFGTVFLLFPVCWFIFSNSLDYVLLSWRVGESSSEAGGLPYLYLLKSLLLLMPALVALQGLSTVIRCSYKLLGIEAKISD